MNINRQLVKEQAKDLIRNNVLKLFLITFVVGIIAGASNPETPITNLIQHFGNDSTSLFGDRVEDYFDSFDDEFGKDFENDFGIEEDEEPDWGHFNDFGGKITLAKSFFPDDDIVFLITAMAILGLIAIIIGLVRLVCAPLRVTLSGMYRELVHGNNMELDKEFSYVFKNAFDKNYWQKLLLTLVKSILLSLLYLLLIIPGVVFSYKWRFTHFIMMENPEISFSDAMRTSDKITKGHKWELFVLDLSFLGWFLLVAVTFGIAGIYVGPYYNTTIALYYENFRIRAFQENAVTQYDYMSIAQKAAAYNPYGAQNYNAYNANAAYPQTAQTYFQPVIQQPQAYTEPYTPPQPQYYEPPAPQPQQTEIPPQNFGETQNLDETE